MQSTKTLIVLGLGAALTAGAQTFVTPKLGGGQMAAEMVHINIFYDADLNQLQAVVDDSYGTPELRSLEPGFSFDPAEAYVVLNGRAYNAQYGWNAGGFFTIPPGAGIWVEAVDSSPGLEVYEGSGRFSSYAPLFGTDGSPTRWKWSGVMMHNTYAVHGPVTSRLFAEYHVYFGDAVTGDRLNFTQFGDTHLRLEWTTVPLEPPLPLEFGAVAQTNGAPLCLLNAHRLTTNSESVVTLSSTNIGFEARLPLVALSATASNGGPVSAHALPGTRLELQAIGLKGPDGGSLQFFETGTTEPTFTVPVGEIQGTNLIRITAGFGNPGEDPYGNIQGRRFIATRPGLYCFTFRALDTSPTPQQSSSEPYDIYLQAGLTINSLAVANQQATLVFGGERGKQFLIEASKQLNSSAGWEVIAGPIPGTNCLQRQVCTVTNESRTFFRIRSQ